jgi:poly-gamma-glutamate synthesis protein (capsule biosynthesis protein)
MFVGDINLGEYYTSLGHGPKSYLKYANVFDKVNDIFNKADFVVGNLEAPLTNYNLNPKDPESVVLRGSPESSDLLYNAGFRVLQVANNHIVQHSKQGFSETLESLKFAGIHPVGVNDQELVIININNERAGFLAASDVPDNTDKSQSSYQRLDSAFISKVKEEVTNVDHLFVLLHWGLEASTSPMNYQRKLIKELQAAGVRGIIGNHPHLFYEVWKEESTIAAPSLGNFIFDLCWDKRLLQSGILDIKIQEDKLEAKVWPVKIEENGCLPTPSGAPRPVSPTATLFDLGDDMRGETIRKLFYFFTHIHKGNVTLKLKFITKKILAPLKSIFARPQHE